MKPKTITLIVIAVLFAIVLIQNMESISINLLFWPLNMPKLILILGVLILGFGAGWLTRTAYGRGRKSGAKELSKSSGTPSTAPTQAEQRQSESNNP